MKGGNAQLVSVHPDELTFDFELEKPCCCDIKVVNNSEHHVAFKVKTTSPKKYFVRPNTGVVQPWDSCVITVTLQPQREYPPDMQCKDKFLLQSTKVAPTTDIDEIPPDTFGKDKVIEECKMRVVYTVPGQSADGEHPLSSRSMKESSMSMLSNASITDVQTVQRLKEERDTTLQKNMQLQREIEMLKRRRNRKSDSGFSFMFAAFVGLIGVTLGLILNLVFSSPEK